MKTIAGEIASSAPVSISKAADILSKFVSAETGASHAVNAYLRRATAAFDELARVHSKSERRKHKGHKSESGAATTTATAEEPPSRRVEVNHGGDTGRKKEKEEEEKGEFENNDYGEVRMVNLVTEEQSQGEGNVGEETERKKKTRKKEKEKSSDFVNFGNDEGIMKVEVKEEQSQGEGNPGEETEGKKLKKKKKREWNNVGNSEEKVTEIGDKMEIKEKKDNNDGGMRVGEGKKGEGKKRKSRNDGEESKGESEEQLSKKKKKKRRREEDN